MYIVKLWIKNRPALSLLRSSLEQSWNWNALTHGDRPEHVLQWTLNPRSVSIKPVLTFLLSQELAVIFVVSIYLDEGLSVGIISGKKIIFLSDTTTVRINWLQFSVRFCPAWSLIYSGFPKQLAKIIHNHFTYLIMDPSLRLYGDHQVQFCHFKVS